ncbi:G patch domain-containing protein 1 homolog [Anopheles marshallii]|uniref:G patch domain-containing protein 1 homolog n=1 Tax=Anopheles marshallii TaxID=1521116 RepID=UPI00237AEC32|nr:G patch domain-containing protein 1 homolog [Anopheles marshallii]
MDEDEETLCRYGTALPAFEEDAVPSKKPITVEDQIVLDSNGKRRFHGAFTGGFSAGYWNTVGSEEGWKPTEFKSSRTEKSSMARQQNPMDFMDEEDLGEFGIAPQRVQAKDDFAHNSASVRSNKRRIELSFSKGPIPGQPVLRSLLEPAKEKTAVKILKKMGWREGQGIGERQTKGEKRRANERTSKEQYIMKMYGCEIPGRTEHNITTEDDGDDGTDSSESDYEITFAPDDFDPLVAALKDNTFGLGYSGLDRGGTSKAFRLFDTLEVVDRNNKKLSIRGQAFGIGALEDDDDLDVYARDDMTRYDFSLEDRTQSKRAIEAKKSGSEANTLEGFCPANNARKLAKKVFRVDVPGGFKPRNWEERRSRFDPIDESRAKKMQQENEHKIKGLGRHDLDPKERGAILGEKPIVSNPWLEKINKQSTGFVCREVMNEDVPPTTKKEEHEISGNSTQKSSIPVIPSGLVQQPSVLQRQYVGSTKEGFKPFIALPEKQERYERFLAFQPTERYLTREQYLESLQPLNLSAWDRERELKEFMQAERMYRPLDGLMSERFVTASSLIANDTIPADGEPGKMREIRMQRSRVMWKPHKDICKRFNVPEPFGGMMVDEPDDAEKRRKEKGKFSVFDYLEAPVTNRRDFVTPTMIPNAPQEGKQPHTSMTTPVDQTGNARTASLRISSKEFFSNNNSTFTPPVDQSNVEAKDEQAKLPTAQSSRVIPQRPEKKRTELEVKVLQATNKKPEEKRDLFKSIFCSSDEEDDETQNGEQMQSSKSDDTLSAGQNPLTDEEKLKMVDSFVAIKPASQMNILRNNSPPRGIFKNLFEYKKTSNGAEEDSSKQDGILQSASKSQAPLPVADAERLNNSVHDEARKGSDSSGDSEQDSASDSDHSEYYGPKLPSQTIPANTDKPSGSMHVFASRKVPEKTNEIWIEKETSAAGKPKKKKKHKHHQHHKSKSKTKHKKDKKKSSHKHKSKH